eukprot:g9467.t1
MSAGAATSFSLPKAYAHPALQPGKIAVITGAANGIGKAAAKACAERGMKVALADIKGELLEQVAAEFASAGVCPRDSLLVVPTDVTSLEENQNLCQKVYEHFGGCDFVLFNVGISTGKGANPVLGMDLGKWKRTLDINLWSTIYGVHCFVPEMIKQAEAEGMGKSEPRIVAATSSRQGLTLNPGDTPYVISKVGQRAVMESVEHELRNLPGSHKLRGVCLFPGRTVTDINASLLEYDGDAERARVMREDLAKAWGPDAMPVEHPVEVLFDAIEEGKFYAVCTDNYKTKAACLGEIRSSAEDVCENRPPASRWHSQYQDNFLQENPEAKRVELKGEVRGF